MLAMGRVVVVAFWYLLDDFVAVASGDDFVAVAVYGRQLQLQCSEEDVALLLQVHDKY